MPTEIPTEPSTNRNLVLVIYRRRERHSEICEQRPGFKTDWQFLRPTKGGEKQKAEATKNAADCRVVIHQELGLAWEKERSRNTFLV